MKKNSLLLVFVASIFLFGGCSSTIIYKYKNFKSLKDTHKSMAIVPYVISLDAYNLSKDLKYDDFKKLTKDESSYLQEYNYMKFLKKNRYSIGFQNIITTNKLIMDGNFKFEELVFSNPSLIASQCNTDVILTGFIYRSKNSTDGESTKNRIDARFSLYDKNGKLLWEMYCEKVKSNKSSLQISKKLINKVIKKLPYKYKFFQKAKVQSMGN